MFGEGFIVGVEGGAESCRVLMVDRSVGRTVLQRVSKMALGCIVWGH